MHLVASVMGRRGGFGSELERYERRTSVLPSDPVIPSGMAESRSGASFRIRRRIKRRITRADSKGLQAALLGLKLHDLAEAAEDNSVFAESEEFYPGQGDDERKQEDTEDEDVYEFDPVIQSQFHPTEMRCLALVAHNHMKPAMKTFVMANKNLLKHFMLTGTNTTMTMLKEVFGDDPDM